MGSDETKVSITLVSDKKWFIYVEHAQCERGSWLEHLMPDQIGIKKLIFAEGENLDNLEKSPWSNGGKHASLLIYDTEPRNPTQVTLVRDRNFPLCSSSYGYGKTQHSY